MDGPVGVEAPEPAGPSAEGARPVRRRLPVVPAAVLVAVVALSITVLLHRDGRLAGKKLADPPSDGAFRVAAWVQPGLGIDDGTGYLAVTWREGTRPLSGTYVVASGTVRGGVLEEATFERPLLGGGPAAPTVEDRVRHLVRGLHLAPSDQQLVVDEAPVVTISSTEIRLEGVPVLPLTRGEPPPGTGNRVLAPVVDALRAHLAARRGPPTEGRVYVAADEGVAAATLGAVLSSVAAGGAAELQLVVKGRVQLGALPLPLPVACEGAPDGTCYPPDLDVVAAQDPLADLGADDARHVLAYGASLPEGAPPGVDAHALLASLRSHASMKRCVAWAEKPGRFAVRLDLDEPEPGAAGTVRLPLRVAQVESSYPPHSSRCLIEALKRLPVPVEAGVAQPEVVTVELLVAFAPDGDAAHAAAYDERRRLVEAFTIVPTVLLERGRIVTTAPYPLPASVHELGRSPEPSLRPELAPVELERSDDAEAFLRLGRVARTLAAEHPAGRWPVLVAAPGLKAGEVVKALAALRGRCPDAACRQREGGYPGAMLRVAVQ